MIRLAFLIVDLEIGGAERTLERHVLGLDRARFEPHVISLTSEGPIGRLLRAAGVPVTALGARGKWDTSVPFHLWRFLRRTRPDVLHTHLVHANVLGRIVGRLAGVRRVVSTIHTLEGRWWHRPLERLTRPLADEVTFPSEAVRRHTGLRGVIVRHGAPAPARRNDVRALFGIPPDAPLLATASRLAAGKGIDRAMEVAAVIDRAHLLIIGSGPLEPDLRRRAGPRVHFAGARDDVPELLAGCDLLLHLSSLGEGWPTAVLEAMAAGRPVVATDVGGTREMAAPGMPLDLVPPGDTPAAIRCVRGRLDRADRGAAPFPFTLERMSAEWTALYE